MIWPNTFGFPKGPSRLTRPLALINTVVPPANVPTSIAVEAFPFTMHVRGKLTVHDGSSARTIPARSGKAAAIKVAMIIPRCIVLIRSIRFNQDYELHYARSRRWNPYVF